MDALVGSNNFQLFPEETARGCKFMCREYSDESRSCSEGLADSDHHTHTTSASASASASATGSREETDHSDAIIKFIGEMLMEEEDLENKPCMLHDCLALQATEKSLYDLLNNTATDHIQPQFTQHSLMDYLWFSSNSLLDRQPQEEEEKADTTHRSPNRDKKNRDREYTVEQRSNKQLANSTDADPEPFEISDPVLLCSISDQTPAAAIGGGTKIWQPKRGSSRGRPRGGGGGRKQDIIKEVVDLRSLLMQCAQAVASFDTRTATELLLRIRHHSSPAGDGTERLAHYFGNALEARMAGTGTALYAAISSTRISAADILKAYKIFITACPFNKMSNLLANKTIRKIAAGATTLHIIDFGILYGYQWPCLIQALSETPGGPPKLRITGIDFPQPGFRPAERVADTGRRLANYCRRFGVPFEYVPIAQKWETITLKDLNIENNELVVVNSLYRLHNVADETVTVHSPRDAVLKLIREIKPRMFIHGIYNGTFNTPFFVTRFRETMFHYSALFDMFEATVGREDPNRMRYEEQVFGKNVMNTIACEGSERVERPETYKQWQARNVRAGFRQVALDREILEYVRNKVRREYHNDFSVDEDGKWMLQGWKGRVIHAISCWQSADATTSTTRV